MDDYLLEIIFFFLPLQELMVVVASFDQGEEFVKGWDCKMFEIVCLPKHS